MVSTTKEVCRNNERMKLSLEFRQIQTKLNYSLDESLTVSFTERGKKVQVLRLRFDCGLATHAGHDKRRACEGCILFKGNRFINKFF